jgi:hypothetical protein
MKYFTPEWWASGCKSRDPIEAYRAAFDSISASLPTGVVELEEFHTLHDSRVEVVQCDFEKGELRLSLAGWNRALSEPAWYTLRFGRVTVFEQRLPPGRDVESELGDLGYWEYELCPAGVEMRALFASSAEFRIVFREFAYSVSMAAP